MTETPRTNLIPPPENDAIVFPYRRAWRALGLEIGILFSIALAVTIASLLLGIPQSQWQLFGMALAISPAVLWAVFSWLPENRAEQPRQRLFVVFILSALVANGVGYPLINEFLQINTWITRGDTTEQIIVMVFGYGIIQEVLKYLVLRHSVGLTQLRTRYDAIAYSAAGAIAYATVLNLHLILENTPPPQIAAISVFGIIAQQLIGSLFIAYGLAETRLASASPILLLGMISTGATINGVFDVVQNNITNTRLGLGVSTPRGLVELILSLIALVGIMLSVAFLIQSAERTQIEAESTDTSL